MNKNILETKITSLFRCIKRIEAQQKYTLAELQVNIDAQDILILNLQRAIQLCVDIAGHIVQDYETKSASTMAENFTILAHHRVLPLELTQELARAVSFRNLAVHEYTALDWLVLHQIASTAPKMFREFAKVIQGIYSLHEESK